MKKNESINSFTDLYEKAVSDDSLLSNFIKGHLVIEFLLVKIIEIEQPKLLKFAEGLNHYKLVELAFGLNHISEGQREVLLLVNKMRNKFAHHLTYEPEIEEVKEILDKASSSFTDLTDGLMQGLEEIHGKKSIIDCDEWVIPEMFVQISYDLHEIYHQLGGDVEDF